jgi:hypothetical protein
LFASLFVVVVACLTKREGERLRGWLPLEVWYVIDVYEIAVLCGCNTVCVFHASYLCILRRCKHNANKIIVLYTIIVLCRLLTRIGPIEIMEKYLPKRTRPSGTPKEKVTCRHHLMREIILRKQIKIYGLCD